jgi:signal transduction histidine kinase/CheY-like chemotaxis protein
VKIRSHLAMLAAGAMLPVLGFAVLVSMVLLEQERASVERGGLARARAMMSAVDAQLRGLITTISVLGASSSLETGDLRAFHAEAQRVLATQRAWLDVTLMRPNGEILVDASLEFGQPVPRVRDAASVSRAVATMRPAIGNVDVLDGAERGVPIRVPVMRDGTVEYVVTAVVRPDFFEEIILEQRLPDGWISGIVDANGRFVARVPARPAGQLASDAYRAAVQKAAEGWSRGLTVERRDVFSAHAVSDLSRWSVGLAIPAEIVLAGARQTALMTGLGVLISIAIATAIVVISGRRIARPVVALATIARSIGSGGMASQAVPGDIEEVTEVAAALQDADLAVRERESLVRREKDALEAADRAKDEFIASLSHELRNPLAALTVAAHILRRTDPVSPKAADARGVIERQTKHMSRMIEDLLDVSRVIMGKTKLTLETLDLADLVGHAVDAWLAAGRFAGRSVLMQAQPAWVMADRTRTEQIVSNLLDNAVKFTPPNTRITVTVGRVANTAVLTVADDGPGIPEHMRPRVFDIFVQAEQGVDRSRGGIGVGLTLVKRLAELQRGSVELTSAEDGRGAAFTVRLPAAAAPVVVAADKPNPISVATPRRTLIVEDSADARQMLREALEMRGHEVFDVGEGVFGIELAVAHRPDVAIVDIGLPDISGYEVARRLREQLGAGIALVALTGYGQTEDRQRAHAAGFDVHLVKPVTLDHLEDAIARVIAEAGRSAAPLAR